VPVEEKNGNEDQQIRERDLKGHIKSANEIEAAPVTPKKEKEEDPLTQDNQLKNAVDILKSWYILKNNLKG
jgi:carboxyl-terminal processing protease